MLNNISYRYKAPLSFGLVILIAGALISTSLLYRIKTNAEQDVYIQAKQLGEVISLSLSDYLYHDSTWQAYKLIKSSVSYSSYQSLTPKVIIVLDNNSRVFTSSDPAKYPLATTIESISKNTEEFSKLSGALSNKINSNIINQGSQLKITTPITYNDATIGMLIIVYDMTLLNQRMLSQAAEATTITLFILAILLPLSWFFGNQIAKPLLKLTNCMSDISAISVHDMDCKLAEGNDEIGLLGKQFKKMLIDLQQKEALEKSIIISDRLAAIGRLVAGISHEINNPLAGMLNAISTYKKYGTSDPLTEKTINLLERGLEQIRNTVSALIVESRITSKPFSPEDINDILILTEAEKRKKGITIKCDHNLETETKVSSSLVRQILLNLLLNAINASPENSSIDFSFHLKDSHLYITVINRNDHTTEDQLELLFEPLISFNDNGTGLGLWVTYQIIEQMNGKIDISLPHNYFSVNIVLPNQE